MDQLSTGLTRRLVCFTADQSVALNGSETIYRRNIKTDSSFDLVGYLNRASTAYTAGKAIGFGYVRIDPETGKFLGEGFQFELDVMGKRVGAEATTKPIVFKKIK